MSIPTRPSDWARFASYSLLSNTSGKLPSNQLIDSWSFGGGTAMMLQIDHRESHDVDIFLPDPQFLFLSRSEIARTSSLKFFLPTTTETDRAFLKIAFKDIGEIDFIVGHSLTLSPTIQTTIGKRDSSTRNCS